MSTVSHPGPVWTAGIDIGTTAVKGVAVDAEGRVLARARISHPVLAPSPGRLEHDAVQAWVDGPRRALGELTEVLGHAPAGVAVAALTPSLAPVSPDGTPVGPGLLYDDERGRPAGPYRGTDPTASPEAAHLLAWLSAACPADGYWPAQAVANAALGGPGAVDLATAASLGSLFDGAGWVDPVANLPAVRLFGEAIGRVGPGTVLGAGSVDALCEQLVLPPLGDGDVLVLLGSTLVVWASVPERREVPGLWCVPQLDGGRWLLGGASNAGGLWVRWVDRVLAEGPEPVRPEQVPVWLPYLRGERVPLHDPARRAGLLDADVTHGPAQLRRAAYEASGFAVRSILGRAGVEPHRIVAAGGGVAVAGWVAALADTTGAPVHPSATPEGGALGAAWLARVAAGLEDGLAGAARWARTARPVDPDPAWRDAVDRRYGRFVGVVG
jgi:xylulokinase